MRKGLRGLLILGAAAAVSLGVSSFDAEAATITPGHVKIDYKAQKLQITQAAGTKDTKFYMATSTVATNKKTNITTVKTAAATEYDAATAGNVIMDLSSFAITKDNYISIWGNKNTDPILVKLPAATTKMKATVIAAESKVRIDNVANAKDPQDISNTVEYCTANGSWSDYYTAGKTPVAADFTGYAKLGATIRFRVKATATAAALPAAANVTVGEDKDKNPIKAYAADGNFASNEIKAKIAKTAAGPKATIDYNLRTIKIPATSEYRLTESAAAALSATFTKATPDQLANGKTATVATLSADTVIGAKAYDFDLRTAATAANGKVAAKPASKITEYKIPAIGTTVAVVKGGTAAKPTYAAANANSTLDNVVVAATANAAGYGAPYVKFNSVVYNKKTGVVTGFKLENLLTGATDKYQVVVSADNTVPAANAKAIILAPGNAKTGVSKITQVAAKEGQYVFIRKMGDAKTTVWSTPYVLMGKVPAAPSEEPAN